MRKPTHPQPLPSREGVRSYQSGGFLLAPLPGREGLGVGWLLKTEDACQNCFRDAVWVAGNVRVPEPDYRPPERFQPPRPRTVPNRTDMLAAVELHRQPHLPARQVDDKPLHHQLPRKPRPKMRDLVPDRDLRIRRMIAQLSSTPRHLGRDTGHRSKLRSGLVESNPPPTPPFKGGEKSADQFINSTAIAVASPPPMHSEASPRFWPVVSSADSNVASIRAPLAPIG
ncbi:hypothetical protein C8J43_102987 [Sphingomonas sp. PP-CE-1G-424]|nr:hypothetical protein C8J43_102987 [Sphingomonas sp. PP-CE-1G-424]